MPGPVPHRLTHLIAHRGNARDYPENTLPALESAVDLGVRFLEFDVHLSGDEIPIVIHDHELARTAGLPGCVFDHAAAHLARTEVNEPQRFGGRHRGTCIPLLSDVVTFLAERREITAFVEIKRASLRHFGHEIVVARVLEALRPVRSRCVVISFDLPAVHIARQRDGQAIGWVLSEYDGHARLKYEAFKPEFLFCDHEKLPTDASRLWRGPWRWAIYEVDNPQLAVSLAERGADFVETMAVAPMIQAFRELAARSGRRDDATL
jgi:glycerophosphoryl diester phosphodiesterase